MATYLSLELAPSADERGGNSVSAETNTNTGDALSERLQMAYLLRARRYELDVRGYAAGNGDNTDKPILFPGLTVQLLSGETEIVFDCDLDAHLVQTYVFNGWKGISVIYEALRIKTDQEIKRRRNVASAGVSDQVNEKGKPWPEAFSFFMFSRDMLAIRIRSALINVEKTVSLRMLQRLDKSSKTLSDAITRLRIVEGKRYPKMIAGAQPRIYQEKFFKIENRDLLAKIHTLFDLLLRNRKYLERQHAEIMALERAIGLSQLHLKQKSEGLSGGIMLPEERDSLRENGDIRTAQKDLESIRAESIDTESVIRTLNLSLGDLCPVLFLVIPQMKSEFTIEDTEAIIINTWQSMFLRIDELARNIDTGKSLVAAHVPIDKTSVKLEPQFSADFNVTANVAEKAVAAVTDDQAEIVLISEEAICQAIDSGELGLGSLDHVVAVHYVSDLMDALEKRRENEKIPGEIAKWFAKVSAVLSLYALLVSSVPDPRVKATAITVRTVAMVFDIPLVVFYTYSALHQLSQLDDVLNLRITESGFESIESIGRIAEVLVIREGLKEQLTEELIKQILENVGARQWTLMKKFIHLRGYYYDLEALLPTGAENG